MSYKTSYISQLTWLRGIAAFFVIVSHTIRATEPSYYIGDLNIDHGVLTIFDLGTFGVLLFFALSGCTLYISNANKISPRSIPSFYVKRFFRIWPAFFVSILFYFAFRFIFQNYYLHEGGHWIEGQFLDAVGPLDILAQIFLVSNFFDAVLLNNAYWSLPIEFQYYLVFPFLVFLTRSFGFIGPIVAGGLFYLFPKILGINASQVFTLAYSFCGGVAAGYCYKKYQLKLNNTVGCLLFIFGMGLVVFVKIGVIHIPDVVFISNIWNFYSLMAIFLVFMALTCTFSLPAKLKSVLQVYGEISYSTYLYHNLIIGALMILILNLKIDGVFRFYILFILTMSLTYIVAYFSYRYIELPSQKIGKKLIH